MNYRMIGFLIGRILLTEAALLALPTVTAILYGESPMPFLTTALALAAVGLLLGSRKPRAVGHIRKRRLCGRGAGVDSDVCLRCAALCALGGYPKLCGRAV